MADRIIAYKNFAALQNEAFGKIKFTIHYRKGGDSVQPPKIVFYSPDSSPNPSVLDRRVPSKGMLQTYCYAHYQMSRSHLKNVWASAYKVYQKRKNLPASSQVSSNYDIDHVFSLAWATLNPNAIHEPQLLNEADPLNEQEFWAERQERAANLLHEQCHMEYLELMPVLSPANRSTGGGIEKSAIHNPKLLKECVDIDQSGDCAYLTAVGACKLWGIKPGSGAEGYPGIAQIARDWPAIKATSGS